MALFPPYTAGSCNACGKFHHVGKDQPARAGAWPAVPTGLRGGGTEGGVEGEGWMDREGWMERVASEGDRRSCSASSSLTC